MASQAEQLAANLNFGAFAKADALKKRILFTLGAIIIYRIGTYIPIPGIDPAAVARLFEQQQSGILGMFNMFSGGAVSRMAIFALNIMPYITASIIVQLLAATVPSLQEIKKSGPAGQKTINQYTRYLTVLLCSFQAYAIAIGLESQNVVLIPGTFFKVTTVITLVGGTLFLMWLGEQVTARGIGNGISILIFAGIIAQLPIALAFMFEQGRTGAIATPILLGFIVLAVALVAVVVFFERAQRRLLVQYPKRQQGNKIYQNEASHLPLRLNSAGVIPAIFASSLIFLPTTIAEFSATGGPEWLSYVTSYLGQGSPGFITLFAFLIIFFTFFYTSIMFNPQETAENLRKQGGFIAGYRPGERTAHYIDHVLTRLTVVGAIYLAFVCVLPETIRGTVPIAFGGTSILIVVSVTMDTIGQIQGHLLAHQYEGLIQKSKLRGKRK